MRDNLTKEVRLHDWQRRDLTERDASLLIAVPWTIDGMQTGERLSNQLRGEGRWIQKIVGVLWCLLVKAVGADEHGDAPGQRLLLAQLLRSASHVRTHGLLHVLLSL